VIVQDDPARVEGPRRDETQLQALRTRLEEGIAAAEDQRHDADAELVDEAVRDEAG
jgi:hypothetical protein